MKLPIDRLSDTPADFEFEGSVAWWAARPASRRDASHRMTEPIRFALKAHRMGPDLYLEGTARGKIELQCSRCLARCRHALRESFRLVLEPAEHRAPTEPEVAAAVARDGLALSDDLEAGWFRGRELDLDHFFLEIISMALPVQPLCRDECLGLCPGCGIDRNASSCQCPETRADSPFAVLARLRDVESGGGS